MTDARALSIPHKLVRRFNTRNPYIIAEALGIDIMYRNDFKTQKGAYKVILKNRFIMINNNLSDEMMRLVCAHELGHDTLHREYGKRAGGLLEFEIFDIHNRCEYEANAFAATLLLDDTEVLDLIHEGYDVVQIAGIMHTNVNLVLLKINELNREGYTFKLPYIPNSEFLGGIGDSRGEL